jgi:UDPglucose 6-dehydrogenase
MANVSVVGLGKVGHVLATCLASAGNRVIGYDPDPSVVEAVQSRRYQSFEPGMSQRLAVLSVDALTATTSVDEAIEASDVSFLIVPTPSNTLGGFSLRYVLDACRACGEAIARKDRPHVVALVSTVMPGASERFIIPALEAAAGRRIGAGLGYCYNPSFIALGEVARGFESPDYVLIGESDPRSGAVVAGVHRSMIQNQAEAVHMHPVEAEIAKIACNTHETMRVTFANMLFSLCSEVPGADVDRITTALTYRIGHRFFKGAVPYGGPCWPRDNKALTAFMDAVGVPSLMPRTIDLANAEHAHYVLRKILSASAPGDTIGLLGLSYKPGTPVVERSFGLDLATWLAAEGRLVIGWDPMAEDEARKVMGDRMRYGSAEDCLRQARLVVVINPVKEFATVQWSAGRDAAVYDPWRCLSPAAIQQVGEYVAMGRGPEVSTPEWNSKTFADRMRLLNS